MKIPEDVTPKEESYTVHLDLNGNKYLSLDEAVEANKEIKKGLFRTSLGPFFEPFFKPDPNGAFTGEHNNAVREIMEALADNLANNSQGVVTMIETVFAQIESLQSVPTEETTSTTTEGATSTPEGDAVSTTTEGATNG